LTLYAKVGNWPVVTVVFVAFIAMLAPLRTRLRKN
jgi:apolipoprotein N-acyltransferase